MNRFYTYPAWLQWLVALLLLILSVGLMGWWVALIADHILYYLLLFLMVPILQFALTPFFRLSGVYKYLSPMLLVYAPSQKRYDLHNGTSFDYLFVMRSIPAGRTFQNVLLLYYLEGLLAIIAELEAGDIPPEIEISGTSYFFSAATAERLGFRIETPDSFYRFNLYMNYLDLLWMYSLSKGKLTFPKLGDAKKAVTDGTALLSRKSYISALLERLYSASPNPVNSRRSRS